MNQSRHRSMPLLIVSSLLAGPALAGGMGQIQVGQPFPALVLPAAEDAHPTSLDEYLGRKVVLHVFASW
ncbi:MAG: hypothetical protein ACE5IK_03505 [Acidobacteriota bacterium]